MKKASNLIKKELTNKTVVVAISGGPDSMVLLDLLVKQGNINIICAHVNHNLRVESNQEEKDVEKYCNEHNVLFEYMKIDNYNNTNFHSDARNIRYKFFENLLKKYNSKYLLTAHHGDDLIETILMRITRGSSLKGYSGFKEKSKVNDYYILRPLIYYTKEDIINYAKCNNILYALDKSNEKDVYTRNRYRKYILPYLKKEDNNVHLKFKKFSETMSQYNEYFDNIIDVKLKELYVENKLIISDFQKEEVLIQRMIINKIFEIIYKQDLHKITDIHTNEILKLINNKNPNVSINLPNNLKAIKSYNLFYIEKNKIMEDYILELKTEVTLENGKKIKIIKDDNDNSNNTIRLDSCEITMPIYVRNKKHGDKIKIKGLNGSKKLKDVFINEKIDKNERQNYPVVVDAIGNILWIPGIKKSIFDKKNKENCDIIIKYY